MQKLAYMIGVAMVFSLMAVTLCGCAKTQKPPSIEEGEFPFRFVYELNGETVEIEDAIVCKFNAMIFLRFCLQRPELGG